MRSVAVTRILFTLTALVPLAAAVAQTTSPSANPAPSHPRVVLVELFTSEGCSDCPPADQLLRQIDGKRYGADTLIVGLSEHVTYWDHIGWKDPYGSGIATSRQYAYGQRFQLESVYTPQMVVNGEAQMVGNNATAVRHGIDTTSQHEETVMQLGDAHLAGGSVQLTVRVSGALPKHGAELFAAVAEDETTAKVTAGENQGRTLAHTSVARTLSKVAEVKSVGESAIEIKVPAPDAGTRRHLVVWLQEPGLGRVLVADSREF